MPREIVSEKSITWAEARELLEKRIKEGVGGVIITQERTLEYLKTVTYLDSKTAKALVKELLENTDVSEDIAVIVANICPLDPGEVRSILELEKEKKYSEETVKKILEISRKYCLPQEMTSEEKEGNTSE